MVNLFWLKDVTNQLKYLERTEDLFEFTATDFII